MQISKCSSHFDLQLFQFSPFVSAFSVPMGLQTCRCTHRTHIKSHGLCRAATGDILWMSMWMAAMTLLLRLCQRGRAGLLRCPDHVSDATTSKTELDWLWKWAGSAMAGLTDCRMYLRVKSYQASQKSFHFDMMYVECTYVSLSGSFPCDCVILSCALVLIHDMWGARRAESCTMCGGK